MVRTAIRAVLAHKVRLLLTAVSIVLGVGLVTGTFIFTDTINAQFDGLFDDIYSGIDVNVRTEAGNYGAGSEAFSADLLDTILAVEGVELAVGDVSSFSTQVLDKDGEPIGGQGPPTLGFSWGDEPSLNPMRIKEGSGSPPRGPKEVVLDVNTVANAGFELGDDVTIVGFSGPETFELVGSATFGDMDTLMGATLVMFELEEASRFFGYENEFTSISVNGGEGVDPEVLVERISQILPDGVEALTGEEEKNEQIDDINTALSFISVGLLSFAGVSIFVGAFIIQNTFRIIVAQRTRELALLRAIGATSRQVFVLVVVEAVIVGLIGSVAGIAFGSVMALAIRSIMNTVGMSLSVGSQVLLARTVIVGLSVGLFLTFASSLLPARKASRISPVAALREEASRAPRRSLRNRAMTGSTITALGVVALLVGLFADIAKPIIYVGAGAAVAFVGVSVLAPLASRPLADVIGWPLSKLFGIAGLLAKENTKRKPRRTASTASALMVGVALVVFFSVFASSTKASISDAITELFPSDLTLQSTNQVDPQIPGLVSPALIEELKEYPELGTISGMQYGRVEIEGEEQLIVAVEPGTIEDVFSLDAVDGVVGELEQMNSAIVSSGYLEESGLSVGDYIELKYARTGEVATMIVGVFGADDFSDIFISTETYKENIRYVGDGVVFANVSEGVTTDEALLAIAPTVDSYGNIKAQTKSDLVVDAEEQIDQALALFTGLLFFAVIISVLGITNTLTLSVYERTREIGLLRAVGMARRQVRRMIRWEAVIIATFGAILGAGIGIALGWAVVRALADEGLGSFSVPSGQVVLALILAAVAGVLAAVWPARKASRMNVLDAISTE